MAVRRTPRKSALAVVGTATLCAAGLTLGVSTQGQAAENKQMLASVDVLPTAQIDGIVWDQEVVGGTVFAGGQFESARPAGAARGAAGQKRSNIMAYNLETGVMTGFAPRLNGVVKVITASPDGKRIYVGGSFTEVDGKARSRIAAFDVASGNLVEDFQPKVDAQVAAIATHGDNVYIGGTFSSVQGQPRSRLAALTPTGVLKKWNASAQGGNVMSLVTSPDGSKVVAAGRFTSLNDGGGAGWGALHGATGDSLPWNSDRQLRNSGEHAGMYSLSADAKGVYVTGYNWGAGKPFEGVASVNWDGALRWVADCKGDTYDSVPVGGVVYYVSHNHNCSAIGGMPDSKTYFMRANAVSNEATQMIKSGAFSNKPAPSLLPWYPDLTPGTLTGSSQAAWTIEAHGDYVVLGGEFMSVNGVPQQGLVRMAKRGKAPGKVGPIGPAGGFDAAMRRDGGRVVTDSPAAWDRDGAAVTHALMRNGQVVDSKTVASVFFDKKGATLVDDKPVPDARYTVRISDADGNALYSKDFIVGKGGAANVGPVAPGQQPQPQPQPQPGQPQPQPGQPQPGQPQPEKPVVGKPGKPAPGKPNPGRPAPEQPGPVDGDGDDDGDEIDGPVARPAWPGHHWGGAHWRVGPGVQWGWKFGFNNHFVASFVPNVWGWW